uniref:Zinc finger PHD-type domain-containing protein n=1 Tax=Hyaloperonospora arabidopsidis (strain Emoy2) TaxID=559515 RepID=M4C6Z7_HYAAE
MLADDVRAMTHSESLKRPVRKCRALSCGKFYHQECISLFPLARIAINTHFICPLHTCAGCNQSGAQQEAVRCMRCPVAYHARCLPRNCVRRISTKLIICPKHAGAEKEGTGGDDGVGGRESKQSVKNAASKHVSRERAGNEDEVVSEASVVSASSARRKEKREKREKRDKKKKKKKKKKDKHKERKESVAAQ